MIVFCPTPRLDARFCCALVVCAAGLLSGCVTRGYKLADKSTPPAVALNLPSQAGASPTPTAPDATTAPTPCVATLRTVIVYQGPGSWKREAYWDEYVVSAHNAGATPLVLTEARLIDSGGEPLLPGDNPWELENVTKKWWQKNALRESGTYLALGAGTALSFGAMWAAAWEGMFGATVSGGAATAAAIGSVTVIALPVVAGGTVYMNLHRKHQVEAEFKRRHLALPLTLAPGQTVEGSLFYRLTPSPRQLAFEFTADGVPRKTGIDLAPLAGLHINRPKDATPAPAGEPLAPASTHQDKQPVQADGVVSATRRASD